MDFSQFLLLRQELLLTLAALVILIVEMAVSNKNKRKIIPFSVVLFSLITVAGFIPLPEGSLFGGSFRPVR